MRKSPTAAGAGGSNEEAPSVGGGIDADMDEPDFQSMVAQMIAAEEPELLACVGRARLLDGRYAICERAPGKEAGSLQRGWLGIRGLGEAAISVLGWV
jgi:hypothetical protein